MTEASLCEMDQQREEEVSEDDVAWELQLEQSPQVSQLAAYMAIDLPVWEQ